jgi:lipid II:glycine glycyltransferase (peptidoglycan interpeptide bridge formation enzyme)
MTGSPTIDKRARRGIARAARDGVQTRFLADRSAPLVYYRLNLLTRHKHGVPPQPSSFFVNLWSAFRPTGRVEILVAELEGQPIASIVLTAFNKTVTYAYGASDARFLKHAPNHALFDAALGWATERGYRYFDFGRTAPDNDGLMEFKQQWGAQFLPLPYFYYPSRGGFVSEAEASWKHRLFTSAWRKLPLGVTAVVGPPLYRHLA